MDIVHSDGFIVASGNEFFTRGGVIDVSDCGNMVVVDFDGIGQLASVKGVQAERNLISFLEESRNKMNLLAIFIGNCEVEGLHWIPGEFVTPHRENKLPDRLSFPLVI